VVVDTKFLEGIRAMTENRFFILLVLFSWEINSVLVSYHNRLSDKLMSSLCRFWLPAVILLCLCSTPGNI